MLARGRTLRESGLFSFESLSTDFVLATLGLLMASLWMINPWLIPFVIVPLLLIHRALAVQQLELEARVDPKTGLFNARHFTNVLREELTRAQRFQRPMSLIMADLDLLRDINNTYGHLAGDAVLARDCRRCSARSSASTTCRRASAARSSRSCCPRRHQSRRSRSPSASGVPSRRSTTRSRRSERADPRHRLDRHRGLPARRLRGERACPCQADLAVYRAKLQGRNRVLDAADDETLLAHPAEHAASLVSLPVPAAEAQRPAPMPLAGARGAPCARGRHCPAPPPGASHAYRVHRDVRTPRRRPRISCRSQSVSPCFVGLVGTLGTAAGVLGACVFGSTRRTTSGSRSWWRSSVSARRCRSRWRRPAQSL